MAEDRNNIDKDETKINSENNQSMGNPSNSNQSNDDEYEKICSICRRPESKAGQDDTDGHGNVCMSGLHAAFNGHNNEG